MDDITLLCKLAITDLIPEMTQNINQEVTIFWQNSHKLNSDPQ